MSRRRCENAKCRAFLRMGNDGPLCDPCERSLTAPEEELETVHEGKGCRMREIGNRRRAQVLALLEESGELSLRQIAVHLECTPRGARHHVQRLLDEGLIVARWEKRTSAGRHLYSAAVDIEALMGARDAAA